MVCLVGALAEYLHHRHMLDPMPTDSLASLQRWAQQVMLQFQKGDKLAVMKSTDSTIINRYFDVAGVEVTKGYAFKKLRLGGAQSAREAGVFSEEVR